MQLSLTTFAATVLVVAVHAEAPFADVPFDQALARAAREEKIVMVDFFTTWCAPCKMLDQTTWKHDGVRAWLAERTVALKIDAEQERELAARYGVRAYPTMVFIEPDGSELDRIVGYKKAEDFLPEARAIASGRKLVDVLRERVAGGDDDPMTRRELARACMQRGLNEEALEHLLWCWDADLGPGYAGVRVSYLLSDIAQLGVGYPPALDALRERRQAIERRLLSGDAEPAAAVRLAQDISALDRALRTPEETLRVYDALASSDAYGPDAAFDVRDALFEEVADRLLEAGRYADVAAAMDDAPEAYAARLLETWDGLLDRAGDDPEELRTLASVQGFFLGKACRAYAVLLGLGELERANAEAARIATFQPTPATFDTLARLAERHGGTAEAAALDALEADARARLDEKGLERFQRTLKRLRR